MTGQHVTDKNDGLDENVFWEKVMAIATVATLITSTLIGFFGIYLGSKAIKLSAEVASAQMRPLLQGEQIWLGEDGASSFTIENNGFGPLQIRQSVYVYFDTDGKIEKTLVLKPKTSSDDILEFLGLSAFINDGRVRVGVPSVGTALGVDKKIPIVQISEHQQSSQFFRGQNKKTFDRAIHKLGVCIVYEALDSRRQLFSERSTCELLRITERKFKLKKP